jgi:hypothetical protein
MTGGSTSAIGAMSAARPLFHRKQKSIRDVAMSQSATSGSEQLHQTNSLFDHLVGEQYQRTGDIVADRFCGLKIDD